MDYPDSFPIWLKDFMYYYRYDSETEGIRVETAVGPSIDKPYEEFWKHSGPDVEVISGEEFNIAYAFAKERLDQKRLNPEIAEGNPNSFLPSKLKDIEKKMAELQGQKDKILALQK